MSSAAIRPELPLSTHRVLHLGGGDRCWRARHGDASGWVDDGNSVATTRGSGLVELEVGLVAVVVGGGRDEGRRGGVEGKARGNALRLLRRRGLGRVAGDGGAFRCA